MTNKQSNQIDASLKPDTRIKKQQHFNLRSIEHSDVDTIADWYRQIEDISIFDRHTPVPINHTEVSELVESLVADQKIDKCRWFIAETEEGTAVGMTALESINMMHGNAILPVFIAEPWRRCGLGIRMSAMMIDLAFKQLRLHRVATLYRSDNVATAAMINRLGFKQEGVSKQAWFNGGKYLDLVNVAVLVGEWELNRLALQTELDPAVTLKLGSRASEAWCWPSKNAS